MKLVDAYFSARKDLESSFQHCAGPVRHVDASFSARKDLEGSFHHSGGPVKFVHASFSASNDLESSFQCCEGPVSSCLPLSKPGKIQKAVFTTIKSYEGRARFFACCAYRTKTFSPVGYLVNLAYGPFSARKDLESSLHH